MHQTITDDLAVLLLALPPHLATMVAEHPQRMELIEIVMDLGRAPEARFPSGEVILREDPVTESEIRYVADRVGDFGEDNRAGLERTLHRISAIRNRHGKIIGLTCRVGRAVQGTIDLVGDVVEQGKSILILGRPGVGKTTMLREVARVLADDLGKRVVIIDTSNEIAGDGDVPHPGIGRARRMQVARPAEQHNVMIEAVENHMPEVIIIDEIGTELEAQAARTIAERGVQLVGTAHGNTLDNLLLNPTLADLIGGITSVTLGDEEAKRRGTQKTVLERKAPPTFDVVIEQQERSRVLVHADVANAVDALLRGERPNAEARLLENGHLKRSMISVETQRPELAAQTKDFGGGATVPDRDRGRGRIQPGQRRIDHHITTVHAELPPVVPTGRLIAMPANGASATASIGANAMAMRDPERAPTPMVSRQPDGVLRIFAAGLNHDCITEVARDLQIGTLLVEHQRDADIIMMHRNRYLKREPSDTAADKPVFVLASRSAEHVRKAFAHLLGTPESKPEPVLRAARGRTKGINDNDREASRALQEAEDAINFVLHGNGKGIELTPQRAPVRRMQHLLAERYNVASRSYGQEPNRRVCIFAI